jgi:hypothetical protein
MSYQDEEFHLARKEHVFRLRVIDGLYYKDIAKHLGLSANTVRLMDASFYRHLENVGWYLQWTNNKVRMRRMMTIAVLQYSQGKKGKRFRPQRRYPKWMYELEFIT